jgi:hypothetical protein
MVKRKTSSSHTLQDKMENTTVTEESDMNETGLNEESETENVEPTTSRLNNQDIESDEEMNDTMILRPQLRHKTLGSSTRKVCSPQRPRTPRYRRKPVIAEVQVEPPADQAQSDKESLYGIMKSAFQEMTTQVVVAIQTAFRGTKRHTPEQRENVKPSQDIKRAERREPSKSRSYSYNESFSSSEDGTEESDLESLATSQIVRPKQRKSNHTAIARLPAFTGKEKWEVWINRFEAVARLQDWNNKGKLQELLPRLQGAAGDFAFDQMSENTLNSYSKLVNELKNRFGVIENKKTYRVQFNRRNQKTGETVEIYATELKRIYEKAYTNRDARIRQEDLLQRFLMGIGNDKARIHIELNKDPKTIEEAVQEVITFMETTKYPQHDDEQYFNKRRFVRQVTRTEKDTSDWKTGKLNGKRPLTTQEEQKADYGASTCHQSVDMQQIQQMFEKMYEEKRKNEEQASFGIPQGRRHFNTNNNHNTNNDMKRQYPNEHMRNNSFQKEKAQMGQSSQSQPFLCFYCGQPGHYARQCFSNPERRQDKFSQQRNGETLPQRSWNNKKSDEQAVSSHLMGVPPGFSLN